MSEQAPGNSDQRDVDSEGLSDPEFNRLKDYVARNFDPEVLAELIARHESEQDPETAATDDPSQ